MRWYFPVLWVVLIGGLLPGVFFVATFWPRRSRLRDAIDVAGLVILVLVLYTASVVSLIAGAPRPTSTLSALFGVVLGAAIDAVLWLRAGRWWRLRRDLKPGAHPRRRLSD